MGLMAVDGEAVAGDEFFEGVIVITAGMGDDRGDWALLKVGAGERFGDVDGAWFAAGVGASPIVQAKREIALLLDFCEYDAGSEGVNGTGGDEDAVTGMHFVDVQEIFEVTATERLLEHVGGNTGLQAAADARPGFGMKNDPCFGFAIFNRVKKFGLLIVGVHLKREPVVGIEELDEQWELGEVCMLSEQFAGVLSKEFREGESGERSGGNVAGAVCVIRDFPAFGVVGFGSESASEQCLKFSAAPANAFEDGSEGERWQREAGGHDEDSAGEII